MPIRITKKKSAGKTPSDNNAGRVSSYSAVAAPAPFASPKIPTSSTKDLNYFFNVAQLFYPEAVEDDNSSRENAADATSPSSTAGAAAATSLPDGDRSNHSFQTFTSSANVNVSAVLAMWLFRQTATYEYPIAERFHLGPADRQPLYALTAQPSVRSVDEFNELAIKRRDPTSGAWYNVCTSDIEPSLDLEKAGGSWKAATLVLELVPVWKKIVLGQVVKEETHQGRGNRLALSWTDKTTKSPIGGAYGLWWETGLEGGTAEAFYIVERWEGFDKNTPGIVKIKQAVRGPDGEYLDPHISGKIYGMVYFYADGKRLPRFVCADAHAQIRLDVLMSGLMTVMVIETRITSVLGDLHSLPAYETI